MPKETRNPHFTSLHFADGIFSIKRRTADSAREFLEISAHLGVTACVNRAGSRRSLQHERLKTGRLCTRVAVGGNPVRDRAERWQFAIDDLCNVTKDPGNCSSPMQQPQCEERAASLASRCSHATRGESWRASHMDFIMVFTNRPSPL